MKSEFSFQQCKLKTLSWMRALYFVEHNNLWWHTKRKLRMSTSFLLSASWKRCCFPWNMNAHNVPGIKRPQNKYKGIIHKHLEVISCFQLTDSDSLSETGPNRVNRHGAALPVPNHLHNLFTAHLTITFSSVHGDVSPFWRAEGLLCRHRFSLASLLADGPDAVEEQCVHACVCKQISEHVAFDFSTTSRLVSMFQI